MSTDYKFVCGTCGAVSDGMLTRRYSGLGYFDIIDVYKFLMYHAVTLGHTGIEFMAGHDDRTLIYGNEPAVGLMKRSEFLEATRGIFPGSADWEFMRVNWNKPDFEEVWTDRMLRKERLNPETRRVRWTRSIRMAWRRLCGK